jgi:hypothetical protein
MSPFFVSLHSNSTLALNELGLSYKTKFRAVARFAHTRS